MVKICQTQKMKMIAEAPQLEEEETGKTVWNLILRIL
jgi:hypothetical protein